MQLRRLFRAVASLSVVLVGWRYWYSTRREPYTKIVESSSRDSETVVLSTDEEIDANALQCAQTAADERFVDELQEVCHDGETNSEKSVDVVECTAAGEEERNSSWDIVDNEKEGEMNEKTSMLQDDKPANEVAQLQQSYFFTIDAEELENMLWM